MHSSLNLHSHTAIGSEQIKKLKTIWQSLQDSNDSIQFRMPVDWRGMGLRDYPSIVKHPMDLSAVSRKLRESRYQTVEQALDDIQLIWDNCKLYNQQECWIYDLAEKLENSFKRMVAKFLPAISLPAQAKSQARQQFPCGKAEQEIKYQDKIKFTERLKLLKAEELGHVVKKIIQICPLAFRESEENKAQIIIDNMDAISFRKILQSLEDLEDVEDKLQKRVKS